MKWTQYSLDQFDLLKADWQLLNKNSLNQAILTADFIAQCLKHFANGDEIIMKAEDSLGVRAIGVFKKVGFGQWRTFQPSQAPLGLWLTRSGQADNDLYKSLASALPGFVLMIDFLQQDTSLLTYEEGTSLIKQFYIETGNLPVPSDFQAYFSGLSKNLRQNINKVQNRAEKQGDVLSSKCLLSANKVDEVIDYFGEFESSGWKGKTGTAVHKTNSQGHFYLDMLKSFAEQGLAECWYYYCNSQVVAVDLCIRDAKNLTILKTAYDEEFKKLSPALNLKLDIARHHGEQDSSVSNIEFFGKVLDWHKRLQSQVRNIEHVTWFRSELLLKLYQLVKPSKNTDKESK